jgi:Protein of unknown function (DUF3048) N-terminal domain/Protein of unknown function (DUF3048) C-terminal domain
MMRRRTLLVALGGLLTACAGPAPTPTPTPMPAPLPPTSAPTPEPTRAPTVTAAPTLVPTSTPQPTLVPTATPEPQVELDVRVWNGTATIHLDGRTIEPGTISVRPGRHEVAALVNDEIVAITDTPEDGGRVDLVVPPPRAGLAIMVENQADARPQTGLPAADVVYEALAEGGITRFLAVYLSGDAGMVGPVRSLRHYFAFLAGDYGADLVHIGASPEGFAWRDAMNLGKLDESASDPGVWRVRTRRAPHNAYTGTAADREFLLARGRQRNRLWGPLLFSSEPPLGSEVAEHVAVSFRPWAYRVDYAWDAEQERYRRSMEGAPHLDADTGEQISPATVVVQFADVERVPNDPKLRLDMNIVDGNGPLLVMNGGRQREGWWSKAAPRSATQWLDADGEPLVIPHGQVWVEIVPVDSPVRLL